MRHARAGFWLIVGLSVTSLHAENPAKKPGGLSMLIEYRNIDLPTQRYVHNTHPNDSFLPNANVPGSAGVTEVGGTQHYVQLGLRCQTPINEHLTFDVELSALVGGEQNRHKNDNDSRPDPVGAFVYSTDNIGFLPAMGFSYYFNHSFYVGADAELTGIYVEHGWDRFDNFDPQHSSLKFIPTVGPKVGFHFYEELSVEATVQFGRETNFGAGFVYHF